MKWTNWVLPPENENCLSTKKEKEKKASNHTFSKLKKCTKQQINDQTPAISPSPTVALNVPNSLAPLYITWFDLHALFHQTQPLHDVEVVKFANRSKWWQLGFGCSGFHFSMRFGYFKWCGNEFVPWRFH